MKLSAHPGIVVGVDGSPASRSRSSGPPATPSYARFRLTLVIFRATGGTWLETPLLPDDAWAAKRGAKSLTTR